MMHARQSKEELKRNNSGVKTNCFTEDGALIYSPETNWSTQSVFANKSDTSSTHHTTPHHTRTHTRARSTRAAHVIPKNEKSPPTTSFLYLYMKRKHHKSNENSLKPLKK